jgi:putative heme-binding domain-containing protein
LHPPAVVDVAKAAANNDKLDIESRKLALKTLDATRDPEAGAAIAAQVTNTAPAELDAYALELLAFDGGDLWRAATDASSVDAYLRARFDNPSTREAARDFIGTARRGAFVPDLLRESLNSARTLDERIRAVQFAARMAIRENTPADLLSTLLDGDDGRLAVEALGILARFRDGAAIARLHAYVIDAKRDRGFRRNAARLLAESMPGAMMLLKSAEADALPIDIEFDVGEALRSCQFDDVRMLAGQVLPPETTRDGKPLPTVSELMALHGDATRGRAIFFSEDRSQCYQCHTIAGNGGHVGPDLSKIGEKYGKEGLLESILNPSAAIGHEYEVWVIETRANDVMTGYLRSDTPEGIELVESAGNLTPIPADDIADRYRSAMSLMPNGLAAGMTAQELADVVAYLESLK